jgi:hypothetical protein
VIQSYEFFRTAIMSYYDDDRGSRRQNGRGGRTRESDYQDTNQYSSRGGRDDREVRQTSLVRRRRDDSVSSVEEIDREFAPGSGYVRETTVRKHGTRPARARSFSGRDRYNDDYDDRSSYAQSKRGVDDYASSRRSTKRSTGRNDRRSRKYESDSSSPSRSPPRRRDRRKSTTEQALGALGLGGVAGALLGKKDNRSRSRDRGGRGRDRDYSSDRSRSRRSRSRGGKDSARSKSKGREKIIQSLKAAALAGATEAFRARNEPGGWGGAKGKRVLTAAVGAAGVDGLITGTGGGDPDKHSTRHIIESAICGLAAGRLVNGPRSQSRGRGRSPSQSRGGAGDLVSGGILAAGAKKLYDRARSKSRGRHESSDSYDSRSPPREKKRSKSITDYARNGLAALGVGGAAKEVDDKKNRREVDEDDQYYHQKYNGPDGYSDSREVGQPLPSAVNGGAHIRDGYDYGPHRTGDPDTDSDSDLGSSSGEEKERKKGTGKQLLTAGLATIATIHAAHSVYQSAEKHEVREKELRKGEISKAEAKKQRNRGYLQDAASVGIAALGIKGAMSEWMEAKEHREEHLKEKEKFERHKAKRAARREKQLMMARRYQESGFSGSMPNLSTTGNGYHGQPPPGAAPYSAAPRMGPTYQDDNPFAATSGAGTLPPADYMQTPPGWNGR